MGDSKGVEVLPATKVITLKQNAISFKILYNFSGNHKISALHTQKEIRSISLQKKRAIKHKKRLLREKRGDKKEGTRHIENN